jgi:hypothetical protein
MVTHLRAGDCPLWLVRRTIALHALTLGLIASLGTTKKYKKIYVFCTLQSASTLET